MLEIIKLWAGYFIRKSKKDKSLIYIIREIAVPKALITCFGTYGATERFAKDICDLTGGDLFEIEPHLW